MTAGEVIKESHCSVSGRKSLINRWRWNLGMQFAGDDDGGF
jgi:hypothetical protein